MHSPKTEERVWGKRSSKEKKREKTEAPCASKRAHPLQFLKPSGGIHGRVRTGKTWAKKVGRIGAKVLLKEGQLRDEEHRRNRSSPVKMKNKRSKNRRREEGFSEIGSASCTSSCLKCQRKGKGALFSKAKGGREPNQGVVAFVNNLSGTPGAKESNSQRKQAAGRRALRESFVKSP